MASARFSCATIPRDRAAVGPLLLAKTLARTGSYGSIFYALAATVVILGIACWYVALPSRAPDLYAQPVAAEGTSS